jgi:hypothetical protein
LCPSFAYDDAKKNRPAQKREAKRRKAHADHVRAYADKYAQSLRYLSAARLRAVLGGAPAFRRFTAALTTGYHPDGSAPEPGFLKARRAGCFARAPHAALS